MHRGKKIIAILDPPRAGFNKDVLVTLRRTRGLDNIIYVACNAKAIQENLLQLTLPVTTKRKAPEFVIKKMLGFDLFPQTPHYEALYVLERT
jgi:tRNA (uracil-5-)-methyltransferase